MRTFTLKRNRSFDTNLDIEWSYENLPMPPESLSTGFPSGPFTFSLSTFTPPSERQTLQLSIPPTPSAAKSSRIRFSPTVTADAAADNDSTVANNVVFMFIFSYKFVDPLNNLSNTK